jgi:hypothetical protein
VPGSPIGFGMVNLNNAQWLYMKDGHLSKEAFAMFLRKVAQMMAHEQPVAPAVTGVDEAERAGLDAEIAAAEKRISGPAPRPSVQDP